MTTPGFTAEVSSYTTSAYYVTRSNYGRATDRFTAADLSSCGACTCDPGRCCELGLLSCQCKACAPEVIPAKPSFLRA